MDKYILDDKHVAVRCEDLMEWARWFESADRRIALDTVSGILVSTVFLGLDYNFGGHSKPALFETRTFNGPEEIKERCSTWDEALEQHRRILGQAGRMDRAAGEPSELRNDDYCPACGSGSPDGCPICGRTVTQVGDIEYTTTDDMLPGEFDSLAPAGKKESDAISTDERFKRVTK